MSQHDMHDPLASYAAALWRWYRGEEIFEPAPAQFGINAADARPIRRQVEAERKAKGEA